MNKTSWAETLRAILRCISRTYEASYPNLNYKMAFGNNQPVSVAVVHQLDDFHFSGENVCSNIYISFTYY